MIPVNSALIRPKQIQINEIFTVSRVLASRGCRVIKEGFGRDTVYPIPIWEKHEADLIYSAFREENVRAELIAFAERGRKVTHPLAVGLVSLPNYNNNRQAVSHTFEWYVGQVLEREFQALSSSYGVKIEDLSRPTGGDCGDFDVLSIMGDMYLIYIECKTGNFNRDEIKRMADRCRALHCSAAVMMLGSTIKAESIKHKLDMRHPNLSEPQIPIRISLPMIPSSGVYKWGDLFFLDANEESGAVEAKLKTILRLIAASRVELDRNFSMNTLSCKHLGYQVNEM